MKTIIYCLNLHSIIILTGNRASCVEKYLRQSLEDLQLSYVDMYLIHTPFGVPETDGDFKRHANGDIVLDVDTNHIETWKVYWLQTNLPWFYPLFTVKK